MKFFKLLPLIFVAACGDSGPQGVPGPQGISGLEGSDGQSSQITLTRFSSDTSVCASGAGVLVKSMTGFVVQSAAVVCDGNTGRDAPVSQYDVVDIIHPCPSNTSAFREVLLKLRNGTIIASFSDDANGKNTRLSVLVPGSYVDTDNSNCHFTVNADGSIS